MKAAIVREAGTVPEYGDFADPAAPIGAELIRIKAASIKNIDRGIVAGNHYSAKREFPFVPGVDGIGTLADGRRVFTGYGGYGMMAEQSITGRFVVDVPSALDDATAAALPNPAVSSWLALKYAGQFRKGASVLVLGATGVTGSFAVQLARHFGAGSITAAGRNMERLDATGADKIIGLGGAEEQIRTAVREAHRDHPFDIVLDYLWGQPAESLINAFTGDDLHGEAHPTRWVQIGSIAGPHVNLSAAALRSSGLQILGEGGGSVPREVMATVPTEILPEIYRLAVAGKLSIETETAPLSDVSRVWNSGDGKRVVLVP